MLVVGLWVLVSCPSQYLHNTWKNNNSHEVNGFKAILQGLLASAPPMHFAQKNSIIYINWRTLDNVVNMKAINVGIRILVNVLSYRKCCIQNTSISIGLRRATTMNIHMDTHCDNQGHCIILWCKNWKKNILIMQISQYIALEKSKWWMDSGIQLKQNYEIWPGIRIFTFYHKIMKWPWLSPYFKSLVHSYLCFS